MSKETMAELLAFLAEHEEFSSVREFLGEGFTVEEVRTLFRELAEGLMREASQERNDDYDPQKDTRLSKEAKEIISYLSPGEEKSLLSAFGFVEKVKSPFHRSSDLKSKR